MKTTIALGLVLLLTNNTAVYANDNPIDLTVISANIQQGLLENLADITNETRFVDSDVLLADIFTATHSEDHQVQLDKGENSPALIIAD
ncbi:hypothetical protein [Aliiglaciecola litoralis]|uniref:Uncharacterized protein n=1 Tax=Aliiglaciecola litoralis TaxID=582857 RepID=A0ABN1LNA3_9ALTE